MTIGIFYALKGCSERAFYRRLTRDYRPLFLHWIIGAKLVFVLNPLGLFVAWDCNLVSVADQGFRHLVAQIAEQMVVLANTSSHGRTGDPVNMKVRRRGTCNTYTMTETVLSTLTKVCHLKHQHHWRG
jgi:hypothetical protein